MWGVLTRCLRATLRTKFMTSKLAAESSPLVGSSRKRILGSVKSDEATLTRRFWPPLMPFLIGVPMITSACEDRPNEDMRSLTLSIRSFFDTELYLVRTMIRQSFGRALPEDRTILTLAGTASQRSRASPSQSTLRSKPPLVRHKTRCAERRSMVSSVH